jgi:hypothetical protein
MRKQSRTTLAGLIQTALPDATVLKYRKADPKGVTPLVMVCSGGTRRDKKTLEGSFPTHTLRVYSLVLHSDTKPGSNWNEEKAEDLLDDIEDTIASVVDQNQKTDAWKRLTHLDTSVAERVEIGGIPYLLEVIQLNVQELK